MSDDSDLISRANSLINADAGTAGSSREISRRMRRRRSFLASTDAKDTSNVSSPPTRAASDDDDLPVLTEVVRTTGPAPEEELASILTVPVDVVSSGSSGRVLDRARAEAVPL